MKLLAVPAFEDNYIWTLHDGAQAIVVDPGDAAPVQAVLGSQGLALAGILVTHHHRDHTGGVDALREHWGCRVIGAARESLPRPFEPVGEGDEVELAGWHFRVLDVPGHTAGHVAFFHQPDPATGDGDTGDDPAEAARPILFCGDTLFSGGCGRLFEGTPAQMHDSLSRLAALPGATRVCCTHEYTESNLRFAAVVEPGNADLKDYILACRAKRSRGEPTLPSSIAVERRINPFLRCAEPEVIASARAAGAVAGDGVDVLAALREWKNRFR
jgi:hydroxyacylglutathione hydrolase